MKSSFYPKHLKDIRKLEQLLTDMSFVQVESTEQYSISIHPGKEGPMKAGIKLILDEEMKFVKLESPKYQWLVADLKRNSMATCADGEGVTPDIRLQVVSVRAVHPHDMARCPEYKHIATYAEHNVTEYKNTMMINGSNQYGIYFIRHKKEAIYQYNQPTSDQFLNNIKIKICTVREYSKPGADGVFQRTTSNRTEIRIHPQVPNINDEEQWLETVYNVWKLAIEMGNELWGMGM
jgi:hypothetical protein